MSLERTDIGKDQIDQSQEGRQTLGEAGIQAMQGTFDDQIEAQITSDVSETQMIGDPEHDAQFWHLQERDDTCAVVAQEGIIEKHTGESLEEEALRQEALENGWVEEGGGTKPADVGKLLEAHDVPVGFHGSGDMNILRDELENGHDVIAGVDAGYLWQDPTSIGEGHAVWVTGLESDQEGNATNVYLNDSGNPEIGGGGTIPADQFQNAWSETDNFMVSTEEAASSTDIIGGEDEFQN